MSKLVSARLFISAFAFLLGALISTQHAHAEAARPIAVSHAISIRNGDWIPLPPEEMRRAAGDAALSRLSDAGRLRLVSGDANTEQTNTVGALELEIALIGPAEIAKLTIRLNTFESPTLVSTASISVRGLDHAGIYNALVHVGERAADRLVAKLDLLQNESVAGQRAKTRLIGAPEMQRKYDDAQAAKRAARYGDARTGFESIVASLNDPNNPLSRLAEDELRYGLPLFEAQQSLVSLGRLSLPGQQGEREKALSRAEHLYRQIQAENPSDVDRVMQSQRALDQMIVSRGALSNAMRANAISQLSPLRMGIIEYTMMEGACPDRKYVERLISDMRTRVDLKGVYPEGDFAHRYELVDAESQHRLVIRCDETGTQVLDSTLGRRPSPASFH